MAAPIVYDHVAEGAQLGGQLFAGKKFWVAQRVPSRNHYLDLIRSNGGEVVMLEKKADYAIADHFRRDCPPGTYSYTFIEESIKQGEIVDPRNHRAGPEIGTVREAGSVSRPTKGVRAAYTADEDRILYKWVRKAEAAGRLASGNEIYKQLEAKYPRHTWQSWRDRYLKQLRDRPPSTFDFPDNAPPSPPTDQSNNRATVRALTSRQGKEAAKSKVNPSASRKVSGPGKTRAKEEYTVDDFESMFDKEHWEELYAFVDVISDCKGERYLDAWNKWAQGTGRTAEQWRQYFEKVVRPQWQRDPASKRNEVKDLVEKRHESQSSQKEAKEQESPIHAGNQETKEPHAANITSNATVNEDKAQQIFDLEDGRFENLLTESDCDNLSSAYVWFAREKKWETWNANPGFDYTELHSLLMSWWNALPDEDKAPYFAQEAEHRISRVHRATRKSPESIAEAYEKVMKRIREGDDEEDESTEESPRQAKRWRSESLTPRPASNVERAEPAGTQQQPFEISSAEGSSVYESQEDVIAELQPQDQTVEDMLQIELRSQKLEASDGVEEVDRSPNVPESEDLENVVDLDRLPTPIRDLDPSSSSNFSSNTPTPRVPQHRAPNFDTQAILSSPSQGLLLGGLPRLEVPQSESQEQSPIEPSSPAQNPESEASTTASLHEFRRSLNENSSQDPNYPVLPTLPRPEAFPVLSSPSSTSSGDPDPPLDASEIDIFFEEQHADGCTDKPIAAALKCTRCRPNLAITVLDAWRNQRPLPNQRGIWSEADDEDVQSGDGVALARLERKHTLDGWGGVTERLRFLDQYRNTS